MAEEFQVGGGTWWNIIPSRSVFGSAGGGGGLCSMGSGDAALMSGSCYGSAGWFGNEIHDMNSTTTTTTDHHHQESGSDQKGQHSSDSGGDSSNSNNNNNVLMDFGLSSSSTSFLSDNWNPTLMLNMVSSEIQKEDSTTCTDQGLSNSSGFPISPTAPFGYPASSIIESLFEPDPEQSIFNKDRSMSSYNNNMAMAAATCSSMHFSNNTPYWNAASNQIRPVNFHPCTSQSKPNLIPTKGNIEQPSRGKVAVVVKKATCNNELPAFKRPRIETPSPLPVFKGRQGHQVRKEKLDDRITAIQQLVSPFGKTDTASVLQEAIEYIKFLHDQVNVLSTSYMKNGGLSQYHQQCVDHNKLHKDLEVAKQDLRSKGLCLVPISSTFPVTNETTSDFWTPTFGATFR